MGATMGCTALPNNNSTSGVGVSHNDNDVMRVQGSRGTLDVVLEGHSNTINSTACRVCATPARASRPKATLVKDPAADLVLFKAMKRAQDDVALIEEILDDLDEFAGDMMASEAWRQGALHPPGIHHSSTLGLPGTALNLVVAPGDMLLVPGTGRIADIGVAGGLMGHVLLVLGSPQVIDKNSEEGLELEDFWPGESVREVWRLRTLESIRATEGLFESDCILYVDKVSQKLTFCAEIDLEGNVSHVENEIVEVWQSPHALRQNLRIDLMREVVKDMFAHNARWSELTAMKAVFKSARIIAETTIEETMTKVLQSWLQRPICTSVIIIFWQRYICKLVAENENDKAIPSVSLDWIMRWMPLKADCALPGDITQVLGEVGWVRIISMPQVFVPLLPPAVVSSVETTRMSLQDRTLGGIEENQEASGASSETFEIQKASEDETSGPQQEMPVQMPNHSEDDTSTGGVAKMLPLEDETSTGDASSDAESPCSLSEGSVSGEGPRPCLPTVAFENSPQAPTSGISQKVRSTMGMVECL